MKISASVDSNQGAYHVSLQTAGRVHSIQIAPKPDGAGSSVNGGEALALALATCHCNDIYREAARRGLKVERVQVEVDSEFGAECAAASSLVYRARVAAEASRAEILDLMKHTDTVAEIQNTLRAGIRVVMEGAEAVGRE